MTTFRVTQRHRSDVPASGNSAFDAEYLLLPPRVRARVPTHLKPRRRRERTCEAGDSRARVIERARPGGQEIGALQVREHRRELPVGHRASRAAGRDGRGGRSARRRARIRTAAPPCARRPWPPRVVIERRTCSCWVVSILTPAEILIATRRLAGARPYLAAVAGMVQRHAVPDSHYHRLRGGRDPCPLTSLVSRGVCARPPGVVSID
jgi:hypothetical protein